jgi:hypothetical protein
MKKRSAHARNPKKHEKYIAFKKNNERLMQGKDYISSLCGLLASLVIFLLFTILLDAVSTYMNLVFTQFHINLFLL